MSSRKNELPSSNLRLELNIIDVIQIFVIVIMPNGGQTKNIFKVPVPPLGISRVLFFYMIWILRNDVAKAF